MDGGARTAPPKAVIFARPSCCPAKGRLYQQRLPQRRNHSVPVHWGMQPIDFGATESIVPFQAGHEVRGQKAGSTTNQIPITTHRQSASYILSFVYKKMALVSHGLYATRVGTALPDAGKVMSIEKRGNQWILVAERAIIAEGK
jgi:hypothetical protein